MQIKWWSSTKENPWQERSDTLPEGACCDAQVVVTSTKLQQFQGFGGCFNELGWDALSTLSTTKRQEILNELFGYTGCNLHYCRVPIGASDFAKSWYSLNEQPDDLDMKCFSIERDRELLIPYIKAAQGINPDITFFASPWSPPTWMKHPPVYNFGTMRWQPEVLEAYALYFSKFVEEYAGEGIEISGVHVQNEPTSDHKFPSCKWTGEQISEFITEYLGPRFEQAGIDAGIWLGTINGPYENYGGQEWQQSSHAHYAGVALRSEKLRGYLAGVGYQWGGKHAVAQTHADWPELPIVQTENECGDGKNSWGYAEYVFSLIWHYLNNGVSAYTYWNMALDSTGMSTWGWAQNSLVVVDKETQAVECMPEFYLMKQVGHQLKKDSALMKLCGNHSSNTIAFCDGNSYKVVMLNPYDHECTVELTVANAVVKLRLSAHSINSVVL